MRPIKFPIIKLSLLCFFLVLSASFLSGQTIKIKKYFPLKEGHRYSYKGTFKTSEYSTELIIKVQKTAKGENIYYFENRLEASTIIGSNIFGLGSCMIGKEGIFTLETFWGTDLTKIDSIEPQLMIPRKFKLEEDINLELDKGAAMLYVNYLGLETVKVAAGEFKDCLKIHIRTVWDNSNTYHEYIWLAKGVGVVKWQRSTGRVDELVKYTF